MTYMCLTLLSYQQFTESIFDIRVSFLLFSECILQFNVVFLDKEKDTEIS